MSTPEYPTATPTAPTAETTGERVRRLIREGAPEKEIQAARREHGRKLLADLDRIEAQQKRHRRDAVAARRADGTP